MFRARQFTAKTCLVAAFALAMAMSGNAAQANSERVLHTFNYQKDGAVASGLIADRDGNLYGTNYGGGRKGYSGLGTVFGLAPDGTYTVLYKFTAKLKNGNSPASGLARDKAGNLYGTTQDGGAGYDICYDFGCGTIFKLAPDGSETVLHKFKFSDGAFDGAEDNNTPILDADGNLYGTTSHGGNQSCYEGCGVVYKLTPKGKLTVLHSFNGDDGANPSGPLIADANGDLYGTTWNGGDSHNCTGASCGVIFELAADGTFTVLHSFQESDGAAPFGPLVRDAEGNLYGSTIGGGDNSCDSDGDGCGVVFKLAPDGTLTVLHKFTGGSDGGFPQDGLIADGSGNLYGTTVSGGIPDCVVGGLIGCGVVFTFAPDGTETVLHSFDDNNGGYDTGEGPLIMDKRGNVYGTTWDGGANGDGTIFEVKTK
ncbi:MAG TPA: choice-of-anchor tandem repeat GloVer-containing protein [Rhizomicrobium sp.]